MNSYKDLVVWQKSMELCTVVYEATEKFPRDELYGLTSQLRRCCVAIPSNIAEGYRRGHRPEYVQFLRIAYGSGAEMETQLLIALRLGYITREDSGRVNDLLQEVMKMLNKLISSLLRPTH